MGSARVEARGAFSLSHASIETYGAHHMSECSGQLFGAVLLIQVSVREGQNSVSDSKRSPALLADWDCNAELRQTTRGALDEIKPFIESQ